MIPGAVCLTLLSLATVCFADTSPRGDFDPAAHFVLFTCASPATVAAMFNVPKCETSKKP